MDSAPNPQATSMALLSLYSQDSSSSIVKCDDDLDSEGDNERDDTKETGAMTLCC